MCCTSCSSGSVGTLSRASLKAWDHSAAQPLKDTGLTVRAVPLTYLLSGKSPFPFKPSLYHPPLRLLPGQSAGKQPDSPRHPSSALSETGITVPLTQRCLPWVRRALLWPSEPTVFGTQHLRAAAALPTKETWAQSLPAQGAAGSDPEDGPGFHGRLAACLEWSNCLLQTQPPHSALCFQRRRARCQHALLSLWLPFKAENVRAQLVLASQRSLLVGLLLFPLVIPAFPPGRIPSLHVGCLQRRRAGNKSLLMPPAEQESVLSGSNSRRCEALLCCPVGQGGPSMLHLL